MTLLLQLKPRTSNGVDEYGAEILFNFDKDMPDGYRHQIFEIVPNQLWMSLRPKRLSIDGKETKWPGKLAASSIAMVDTGGGPVFLSDPEKYVWATTRRLRPDCLPGLAVTTNRYPVQATRANLSITLSDGHGEFSYHVETAKLPDQSLTLVMCKQCYYMERIPMECHRTASISAVSRHASIISSLTTLAQELALRPNIRTWYERKATNS